jgi:hypothetical protein
MIICNGTLQAETATGGGIVHGKPQAATVTWGDRINCNISYSTSDHKGTYVDGGFTRTAATLLIEPQEFNAKRIKVTDNLGADLGTYEVQSIHYLQAVGCLQITIART